MAQSKLMSAEEAIGRFVSDGDIVYTGYAMVPEALCHEIIRQRKSNLTTVGASVPAVAALLYITGCANRILTGYIDGPGGRQRHGLKAQGPNVVISTLGVLRFDTPDGESGSCEMYLDATFPNVSANTVRAMTGWDLKVSVILNQLLPPTTQEVAPLRSLDPLKFHLAEGRY